MSQHPLDILLRPRSVAFVGASDRPDSTGAAMLSMSLIDGFDGTVYPINPRLKEIAGEQCYPDLAALPDVPDHVVIGVASRFVEEILDQAIELGIKAATIFASCHLDDASPALPKRIAAKAAAAGMSLCGANCMGFYTPSVGLRVSSAASPAGLQKGGIAWIAQSGSTFSALANNDRRLGFTLAISTGMELVTTVADYMDWALHQPETRVIGLFIETIRDPAGFMKALEIARQREIPVVALKVGRTAKSAQMAVSHTGAIAGNDAVYEAVFRAYGVHRVADMDEMAATLALFDMPRKPASGKLGTVHDSGGERELLVDLAEDYGLEFATLKPATCGELAKHLEPGLVAENPLDAFGTHNDLENRFATLISTLVNDPNVGIGLFLSNPRDNYAYAESYSSAVIKASEMTQKPLALVSNYSMADDRDIAIRLKQLGIPLLRGTRNALLAVSHVMADRDFRERKVIFDAKKTAMSPFSADVVSRWRSRLTSKVPLAEADGLTMLADFGLSTPSMMNVASMADLEAALTDFNFPVVLKTAEDHAHKSDVGGVRLNIADADSARSTYREMSTKLGARALLMEMVPSGVELSLGAIHDSSFGSVVIISAGGVLIEFLADNIAALAPFDEEMAEFLIGKLQIARLLAGYRGQSPANMQSVIKQVTRFSQMVVALGDTIAEIDVNPLICGKDGAFAADCLVVLNDRD
ncbi:acetate--CoA ligase family protein [Alphaproteobacteria bacterium]|nr:acetate--CoA ligase family protein [Alphaproteobacteria bacterium]